MQTYAPDVCHHTLQTSKRAKYAGNLFRTAQSQVTKHIAHDDSHLRWDYKEARGGRAILTSAFGTITKLFSHAMYPGGPARVVASVEWLRVEFTCPIAKTTVVSHGEHPFLTDEEDKFVFLDNCYQIPVALWPHDLLGELPAGDPRKGYYDVIDHNQLETFHEE